MKISIFGLGYVGCVSAACLAQSGHHVTGVDSNAGKVSLMASGKAPVVEPGLQDILAEVSTKNLLKAVGSEEAVQAVHDTDVTIICVGTPSRANGSLDLAHLTHVCEQIGAALKTKNGYHVVVIRSTILPGTIHGTVLPSLEKFSGKKAGHDFGLCNNPEFLREGSAIHDFWNPPKTVIGESDQRSGAIVADLYSGIKAPLFRVSHAVAEMVKYADNTWHATKVAFANEIGKFCKTVDIDSHEVMRIFCEDTKLNLSPYYLKPGFAFGGSCLPKDLRALTYRARELDVSTPLLNSLIFSNRAQVEHGISLIIEAAQKIGSKSIGVLGFSFKANTDDLRESPIVDVIERLIGKGYDLKLYDKNVQLAKLVGANRDYIYRSIPHIERLMVDQIDDVLSEADIVVIGNNAEEFSQIVPRLRPNQYVIDFVRLKALEEGHKNYVGICW